MERKEKYAKATKPFLNSRSLPPICNSLIFPFSIYDSWKMYIFSSGKGLKTKIVQINISLEKRHY